MKKIMLAAMVLMSAAMLSAQGQQQAKQAQCKSAAERVSLQISKIDKIVSLDAKERAKLERVFTKFDAKEAKLMKKGMALREKEQQKVKDVIGSEKFQKLVEARKKSHKGKQCKAGAGCQGKGQCHQGQAQCQRQFHGKQVQFHDKQMQFHGKQLQGQQSQFRGRQMQFHNKQLQTAEQPKSDNKE